MVQSTKSKSKAKTAKRIDELVGAIKSLSDDDQALLRQRLGWEKANRKEKKSTLKNYYVVYEYDEKESLYKDIDILVLAGGYNVKFATILLDELGRICAYELIKDDKEFQELSKSLLGKKIVLGDIERLTLASLITKLETGLVVNASGKDDEPFGVQGFPSDFAPKLTEQFYRDNEQPARVELLLEELTKVANENQALISEQVVKRLSRASYVINWILYYRLSAMITQLLAEGLMSTFSEPVSRELVEQVEKGLLYSLRDPLRIRAPGRPPGNRRFSSKEEFENGIGTTIQRVQEQGLKVTQESVAITLGVDDSQLREWLRDFGVDWRSIKNRGEIRP